MEGGFCELATKERAGSIVIVLATNSSIVCYVIRLNYFKLGTYF